VILPAEWCRFDDREPNPLSVDRLGRRFGFTITLFRYERFISGCGYARTKEICGWNARKRSILREGYVVDGHSVGSIKGNDHSASLVPNLLIFCKHGVFGSIFGEFVQHLLRYLEG